MGYIVNGDTVHANPPRNGCNVSVAGKQQVSSVPSGKEKCDICFGLPR